MANQRTARTAPAPFTHDDMPGNLTWAFGMANAMTPDIAPGDSLNTPVQPALLPVAAAAGGAVRQIVFIDGNVPDAQLLAAGVAPGVRAVILDPARDGVLQIAAYLASHSIRNLAAIDLVAHGADGLLELGNGQLNAATIGQYQAPLAAIAAALQPGGDIQIYGCDVAQDATGDAFLQQLSQATGGANIAAASHLVGSATQGGSWSLNVDVGTVDVASPFTAAAASAYPDLLGLSANQIVFGLWNDGGGTLAAGNRAEQFGVSGATMISGSTIDLADGSQSNASVLSGSVITGAAVDTALHSYFLAVDDAVTHTISIQQGSITSGGLTTLYTIPIPDQGGTGSTVGFLGGLSLDAQHGMLYYALSGQDLNTGLPVAAYTGIFQLGVTGGTPTMLTSSSAGLTNPLYLALDTADNLLFFDDAILAAGGFPAVNNLDEVNLSTGAVTVLHSFTTQSNADAGFLLQGMDVNASSHTLYLATADFSTAGTSANSILSIPYSVTGSGNSAQASIGSISTLYSGAGAFQPSDIVIDPAHGIFYSSGIQSSNYAAIYEGSLSSGSSLTQVLSVDSIVGTNSAAGSHVNQLALLSQPVIGTSGTVTAVTGSAAVTVDAGATVTDQGGQLLVGATISGALTGDTLSFNNGGTFTFGDGDKLGSSFSNGILTLTGNATATDYQTAFDAVTFATTSESTAPRTLNWTVNDGVVSSATSTSTVQVHVQPSVTAGATPSFTGGGSAVLLDAALTLSDPSSSTLSGATVTIGGFISGDTLSVGTPGGLISGFNNGTLTLAGSASLTTYKTALESISYSFSPANGDPTGGGSHTGRSITWLVNDGVASGSGSSTLNVVHAAPNVTAGGAATYPENAAPVTLDAGLSVSDPDSGGNLAGATVSISSGFLAGDTLNFTNQNGIAGSYNAVTGVLTLTGSASIANYQTALQSVGYSFSGDPTNGGVDNGRTITWTVTDGVSSSAPVTSSLTTLCFCAGTLIRTPGGEVPVETLSVGDAVLTASGAVREITWIGEGRLLATRGRRGAATPVIVAKDALAPNVPHRDLRVTKGHALFLDGVLIPVEFLVNHRSIRWDDRAQEVSLYHVELATHDVLVANGAPAESYRDDGNRWLFRNANTGWHLPPLPPCAPVLTGGDAVDAAWRRLLDRSGPRNVPPLTDDPDLHLLVDGRRVDAAERREQVAVFRLPACADSVHIVSRDAVPAELGLARDPRSLGIALRRIVARQAARLTVIEAADARLTQGFHGFEPEAGSPHEAQPGFRWTDGHAVLPAAAFAGFTGPFAVELHLTGQTRYVADATARRAA